MANTIQKESKIIYLQIGQNYENLGVQKQFDVSEWTAEFPDAHIYLLFKRPGEEAAAPVNTTLDEDGILTWTVSNWETGIIGIGFAEIRAIDGSTGLVKKSHVIPCSVEASVTDEDAAPDYPSWVDRMLQFGENVDSIYATLPHELEEGIASIQQEAQTQTEAIEQKGITTRASIPADYTTLSDEVTGLKSALNVKTEYSPVAFSTEKGGYTPHIGEEITFDTQTPWKKTSFVPEIGNKYKITFYNNSGYSTNVSYVCEVDNNNIVLAVHGIIDKSQSTQQNEVIISPLPETATIWVRGKNGGSYPFTIDKVVIRTEVDDLKESVAILDDSIAELSSIYDEKIDVDGVWVQGALRSSDGATSNSTTRIRTVYMSNDGLIYKADVPSEYKVAAFLYESTTTDSYVGCWNGATPVKNKLTWLQEIRLDAIPYPFVRLVVSKTNDGTIDVDESNACSFYVKTVDALANSIKEVADIIGVDGNLISGVTTDYTVDDATGILIRNTSYKTTELIGLPKWDTNQRYNPYTKLYAKSYDGTSYGTTFTKVVFYAADKSVLSVITSGGALTIPEGAAYVRVVFPKSNTYLYVGCGILTDEPTYQPYHKTVSKDYIPSIAGSIRNSDGAKTNLVKTALQYLGNTAFGYGNTHTAYSESADAVVSDGVTNADGTQTDTKCYDGTKFQIDCSGFTRLTMQCIYPEYTRHYGNASNVVPPWGYRYDENAEYDTPQGRLTAHKQALYAYQRGFMYPLKEDYSNADVGDMIFVANSASMWGSIGHARIITNAIPLKTGGKQITVMESNSYLFPPVHASKSSQRELNQYRAARFPLPYAAGDTDVIGRASATVVQTSGTDGIIAEISLGESTQDKEIYTIIFKADFGNSENYAVVAGLGNDISFENVLVYNGLHVYTVVLPVDGSAGSDTVVIKAHGADTVTFGGAKIYKGFHTPTMSEFD